ncbi:NUDIX hydrolase [Patulibacter minatonensis]|uniref:NUDIX hydrolase n=1 Tax=Patulibacter minatonensis TaxID=298163 RepID=UPI0006860C99|nr:CoA pyrophosphatase [Patulibacter minatonensis]
MGSDVATEIERWLGAVDVHPERAPDWLRPLVGAAADIRPEALSHNDLPATTAGARQAAVLVLFGEGPDGPDVLLQQRAGGLRNHAGQPSFPGGGREDGDRGPVQTALREAVEETGLDPAGVTPLTTLPRLFIPPSGFQVTAVLAHWHRPSTVTAVDVGETARVARVPLRELADPDNRLTVELSRWVGPAFDVAGMLVWGFTGEVVAALLRLGGWERPWDAAPRWSLDEARERAEAGHPG